MRPAEDSLEFLLRILTLDIETAPALAHVWRLWDENIPLARLVEHGTVICFGAKWLDERNVMTFSDFHDGHEAMVEAAHRLIDEADAIVHYNGTRFDMKHLRREMLLQGLTPPSPHRDIDLLGVVKREFKFDSNKLDFVAQELGLGAKVKHDGFELWKGCMADDPKAWRKMLTYCRGDVRLTEKLYKRLMGWHRSHPNVALYDGLEDVCPTCATADIMKRGIAYTPTRRYQRYQCQNPSCGRYFRGKNALPDETTMRNAA